jgi:hypothetical protein
MCFARAKKVSQVWNWRIRELGARAVEMSTERWNDGGDLRVQGPAADSEQERNHSRVI